MDSVFYNHQEMKILIDKIERKQARVNDTLD